MATSILPEKRKAFTTGRLILALLLLGLCVFKLFMSYRGLDQPVAMDQAQIARNVAQGKGFQTQFLRPIEVVNASAMQREAPLNFEQFRDTNHAPLNICAVALALRLTGYDKFDEHRMQEGGSYIYEGDRIVSATSTLFFLLAMVLTYILIARLFDEVVACSSVAFMALSELMLQYAVSGLPQPLMLCLMLATLHCLTTAIQSHSHEASLKQLIFICLSYVGVTLLCLTGWLNIWCALGLILFCAFYFRPFGAYAVPGFIILALGLVLSVSNNSAVSGSILGNASYGIYNCFGGGEEFVMRTTNPNQLPLNSSDFVIRLFGYAFSQFNTMYVNMGSIVVTPFFLLALINRYKSSTAEGIKWAVFCMWSFACIGMALYGVTSAVDGAQICILFTPIFTAYGVTLVFNFLARLKLEGSTFNQARGLAIFLMVLISAGPFLFRLPQEIYQGIWLSDRGRPNFPPYYPPALNINLVNASNPRDIIMTDQPWAVAWYANRKALWLPMSIDDLTEGLDPIFYKAGIDVQGILVTPSSHSPLPIPGDTRPGGMSGIVTTMGDYAPLAMEGKLLLLSPRHNMAFLDLFVENASKASKSLPLGALVSSRGRYANRQFLLGTELIYYSKNPAAAPAATR